MSTKRPKVRSRTQRTSELLSLGVSTPRMDITHYKQLPDGMDAPDVAREFERLLSEVERPDVLCVPVVEALCELADRQWHTSELLHPDLRARVERWFQEHWLCDPKFVDLAAVVAAHLGLRGVIPLLERTALEFSETEFGREIQKTLLEITPDIDDPYSGMRTQR
jgi:hypothetical protein